MMNQVVTRFAPSPTGLLHAGNYRTAVFAYLFAKHESGKFIVRIEDTDKMRSKPEYETPIFETLAWLQLPIDEQYRQSEHRPRHRELLEKLIKEGAAYISKEIPQAPGDREEVIRFKNPGGAVSFTDVIRGEITTDVTDLGDFIVARSLDEPVFHFAVAVDDSDEGVTHVVRGADHISNTARQMLILRALGFTVPMYAHLPLILDNNHKKLSKRTGAKALIEYRDEGILPEAMLNYIAFLGWNPGDEREYMPREELIQAFDISRVQKGSGVFDEVKLFSVNQHWMRKLPDKDFLAHVLDVRRPTSDVGRLTSRLVPLLKERSKTFKEAREMLSGELYCFFREPVLELDLLTAKEPIGRLGMTKLALESLLGPIKGLKNDVSAEAVKEVIMPLADAEEAKGLPAGKAGKGGRGAVLWPLRYALSGQERSPDPFTIISIIGAEKAVSRIDKAIAILDK